MAHTENSLSRLNKDDLIHLALDYQQKYDITLDKISKELAELWQLDSDLAITKAVTSRLETKFLGWNVNAGALLNAPDGKL